MHGAVAGDAGVVHQDLDRAQILFDARDPGLAGFEVADIEAVDRDAGFLVEGVGDAVIAAIDRGPPVARIFEPREDRRADAARAAGDRRYPCHTASLLIRPRGGSPGCFFSIRLSLSARRTWP